MEKTIKLNYKFIPSHEIQSFVRIKIKKVLGEIPNDITHLQNDDFLPYSGFFEKNNCSYFVVGELYSSGRRLTVPQMTKYVKTNTCTWDKALTFPMKYRDCPQDTEFLFTVYGIYSPSHIFVVGGTRISLYSSKSKMRSGGYHLRMYLHKKG
ncbi:hypothetical protein M0813_25470 [Anaeramoeba flamelloides]|uniref:C2 PI3K-type domain-containing protein n=1 Tax=Anaeramoeba flamelloides TaxID=1746091 RepID=A0ABQ8Y202_9EUKA|nr:hypothetical protein M0813_25470 [Anaeramoeba flamelloides]